MTFCSCKGGCACKTCACGAYCKFFDVLGNQNRLHILNSLRAGPKNVSQIIRATGLEQTAISHSLKRLEEGNFVTAKREGKYRIYELNHSTIEPLLKLIERHIHS
jgi:DNA-binding transcriptional ArsR family regulator